MGSMVLDIGRMALMEQLITLQQTVISLLNQAQGNNDIVFPQGTKLVISSKEIRTGSVAALSQQFQRMAQAAPIPTRVLPTPAPAPASKTTRDDKSSDCGRVITRRPSIRIIHRTPSMGNKSSNYNDLLPVRPPVRAGSVDHKSGEGDVSSETALYYGTGVLDRDSNSDAMLYDKISASNGVADRKIFSTALNTTSGALATNSLTFSTFLKKLEDYKLDPSLPSLADCTCDDSCSPPCSAHIYNTKPGQQSKDDSEGLLMDIRTRFQPRKISFLRASELRQQLSLVCIDPGYLHEYSQCTRVLFLDCRTRREFDNGHMYASNIICVDPFCISLSKTAEELEGWLSCSPEAEKTCSPVVTNSI